MLAEQSTHPSVRPDGRGSRCRTEHAPIVLLPAIFLIPLISFTMLHIVISLPSFNLLRTLLLGILIE